MRDPASLEDMTALRAEIDATDRELSALMAHRARLIARAAYVPCYAFGLVPWRSVVFAVGNAAAVLMILAALL